MGCIVDENINPAESGDGLANDLATVRRIFDIAWHQEALPPGSLH